MFLSGSGSYAAEQGEFLRMGEWEGRRGEKKKKRKKKVWKDRRCVDCMCMCESHGLIHQKLVYRKNQCILFALRMMIMRMAGYDFRYKLFQFWEIGNMDDRFLLSLFSFFLYFFLLILNLHNTDCAG